jgi:hypothetical protein
MGLYIIYIYIFAGNRSLSHLVIPSTHSGDILSPNAFYGCNQISQVDMRIAVGCTVCDEFIIGTEEECRINKGVLLENKDQRYFYSELS